MKHFLRHATAQLKVARTDLPNVLKNNIEEHEQTVSKQGDSKDAADIQPEPAAAAPKAGRTLMKRSAA